MNYQDLRNELTADPLGRGYSGMTNLQAAASLNTANRTRDRVTCSSAEIFECLVPAEYAALDVDEKKAVDLILGLGDGIRITPGSRTRGALLAAFGAGTGTRTNLAEMASQSISRAAELGWIGAVTEHDIAAAKAR